jgi:hypothetical protein
MGVLFGAVSVLGPAAEVKLMDVADPPSPEPLQALIASIMIDEISIGQIRIASLSISISLSNKQEYIKYNN